MHFDSQGCKGSLCGQWRFVRLHGWVFVDRISVQLVVMFDGREQVFTNYYLSFLLTQPEWRAMPLTFMCRKQYNFTALDIIYTFSINIYKGPPKGSGVGPSCASNRLLMQKYIGYSRKDKDLSTWSSQYCLHSSTWTRCISFWLAVVINMKWHLGIFYTFYTFFGEINNTFSDCLHWFSSTHINDINVCLRINYAAEMHLISVCGLKDICI